MASPRRGLSLKDRLYIRKRLKPFKGKGEHRLDKILPLIPDLAAWERRKALIRKGILRSLGLDPFPKRIPLKPVIHTRREYGDYVVYNLYFETIPGFYITGSLYYPNPDTFKPVEGDVKGIPILLKPHGHRKNKRYTDDNQNVCASFARLGFAVFTYDMVGYSDSIQLDHHILHAGTFQTWNSIRALDFMQSLDKFVDDISALGGIDADRVGVTGGSGGGTQTFLLTAVDDRVKANAPVVMVSSFFFGGCICESGLPIHKGDGYRTNNAEIAAMAAPRPQLIVSVGTDWTRFTPILEYPFIKRIYELYGAGDKVRNVHFPDEKHDYGPSKRQAAYRFFSEVFGLSGKYSSLLDGSGKLDEKPNVIEPEELLHVFNDEHPLPPNALKSEDEVLAALRDLQK